MISFKWGPLFIRRQFRSKGDDAMAFGRSSYPSTRAHFLTTRQVKSGKVKIGRRDSRATNSRKRMPPEDVFELGKSSDRRKNNHHRSLSCSQDTQEEDVQEMDQRDIRFSWASYQAIREYASHADQERHWPPQPR
jgi:hypothetical protein